MPVLETGGAMTIVAHPDDDILFMNPDIVRSIEAGTSNITIYVTAGDAGLGEDYWSAREDGVRAAYLDMVGGGTWIDETVTVEVNGESFEIASSYLAENPGIRLYFLRLPDGGGILDPGLEEQLAQLEAGALSSVTTIDGANSYSREDLVGVMTELMEMHAPSEFRFQLSDGAYAGGEHSDHLHATEFAEEALAGFSGDSYSVTHYVQYQSGALPANLSEEDAARALEIMQAYAEHDLAVLDESGQLAQIYVDWTDRQYVAEQYTVDNSGDPGEPTDPTDPIVPVDPGAAGTVYSLTGPDALLFTVDPATGAITPQDWFTPSLDDAWDQNEDHVYEVSLVATPGDGSAPVEQPIWLETTAEGVLTQLTEAPGGGDTTDPTGPTDPVDPGMPSVPTDPGAAGTVYSLTGPDAFLFTVDPATGAIAPQDWFTPSLDDAWDQNEDHVYEVSLVATPGDGSAPVEQAIWLETTAEGVLTQLTEAPGGGDTTDPTDPTDPVNPDAPSEPADPSGPAADNLVYSLTGPDAQLFVIDPDSGAITLQDWFVPSYDDAWDRDEDHIYQITLVATPADGGPATSETLSYQTQPDGSFGLMPATDPLMASLSLSSLNELESALPEEEEEVEDPIAAVMI